MQKRIVQARNPTVLDVANAAGCSIATVSRALTRPDSVSEDARQRVVTAVRRLGYVPNGAARALRSLRTKVIGAVIPTLNHAIYAELIDGLQRRLATTGVSLIHNTDDYDLDTEVGRVRLLLEHRAEGIVLVGSTHRSATLHLLAAHRVPFVVTYAVPNDKDIPCVGFDNGKAGMLAAAHLLRLGHRRVAMIAGMTEDNDRAGDRLAGFVTAMKEGGASADPTVVEAPYRMDSGYAAMEHLLRLRAGFTAVFCGSDVLAVGALKACRDNGVTVPREMSVLGFDNLEITRYVSPELSTIEVPAHAMGEQAAEYLLATPPTRRFRCRVELEARLVLRGTTAAPHVP